MVGGSTPRTDRKIRVQTQAGTVEGVLHVATILRTLDDLNMAAKSFVTVHDPQPIGMDWRFGQEEVALAKKSILFVMELSNPPSRNKELAGTFSRGAMKLRVGEYDIEGYMHVPPGGECLSRLNQDRHQFLPLTSASIIGPDSQFAAPFLAVNREHISAAQEVFDELDPQEDAGDRSETDDDVNVCFEVTV